MSDKYATLSDLSAALEKLEAKVPSRWEVRALILGAIVVSNYDVPSEVTTAAVGVSLVGFVGKAVLTFFTRT